MEDTNVLNRRFTVLLDDKLISAIRAATADTYTKPSAYIRQAVAERLKRDGVELR